MRRADRHVAGGPAPLFLSLAFEPGSQDQPVRRPFCGAAKKQGRAILPRGGDFPSRLEVLPGLRAQTRFPRWLSRIFHRARHRFQRLRALQPALRIGKPPGSRAMKPHTLRFLPQKGAKITKTPARIFRAPIGATEICSQLEVLCAFLWPKTALA